MKSKHNKTTQRVIVMAALTIGLFFASAKLMTAQQSGAVRQTAVAWPNGKTFYFKGSEYICYDNATDHTDAGYPRQIASGWPGLWADGIDAVFVWPNGKAYFFRGSQYIRWDIRSQRVDSGYPTTIASGWPGVWSDHIDAAVSWPNGKTYFFRGNQFISYDTNTDRADPGGPKLIAGSWPSILGNGIDAATIYPGGKAFFYQAGTYLSYDVATNRVDAGWPRTFPLWDIARAQAPAPQPAPPPAPPRKQFMEVFLDTLNNATASQPGRPNFLMNLMNNGWNFNYEGGVYQVMFGPTGAVESLATRQPSGVTWTMIAPNTVRWWDAASNRTTTLTFTSENTFTGIDSNGKPSSGNRITQQPAAVATTPPPFQAPPTYQPPPPTQPTYQAPPAQPTYQAPPTQPTYQAPPTQPTYQAPPTQPTYQQPPTQPTYQAPPTQPTYQQPPPQPTYQAPPTQPTYQAPPTQPTYQQPPTQPTYQAPPTQPTYQPPPTQPTYPAPPAQPTYQPPPTQPAYQPTPAMSRQQLEDEFRTCSEAVQHGASTDLDFTASLYWRYLGHTPDGNLQLHANRITNGSMNRQQLEDEFRSCSEAAQHGPSTDFDFTGSLYWRYLGHGPDGNLQMHANRLKAPAPSYQPPPTQPAYQQPAPTQPQNFIPNLVGTMWAFTTEGQDFHFEFERSRVLGFGHIWQETNPNQVRVFDNATKRELVMNFDSPSSFRGISWDGRTPITGTRVLDPLYLSGMAKVIGTYKRYNGVENDWHIGTITQDGAGYRWTNKAGVSWTLTPDVKTQTLFTGRENPYFQDGNTNEARATREFNLSRGDGKYTGFNFMNDYYKLQ